MHLGNEALAPECAALFTGVAAIGLSAAAWSARRETAPTHRWLAAGVYGGVIFAAQMVNVPLLPYSSGHLVGGVLLAAALGPGLGAITMAIVLTLQALCLGDGGIQTLGANITNMALLPAGLVALTHPWLAAAPSTATKSLRLGVVASVAVWFAAALIVLQVALFRSDVSPLPSFASEMLLAHLVIGLAEGALTAAAMFALAGDGIGQSLRPFAVRASALSGIALALLVLALPMASELPDGYEASAERSGWSVLLAESSTSLAVWQQQAAEFVERSLRNEQVIALLATILAAILCLLAARLVSRSPATSHT